MRIGLFDKSNFNQIKMPTLIGILKGISILFLTSQISIPFEPVPVTLQSFGILMVGLLFKPNVAICSVGFYLLLGVLGLPLFANFSGGIRCLLHPSGGYLLGFFFATLLMTRLGQINKKNFCFILFSCVLSSTIIYLFGVLGLLRMFNLSQAIDVGVTPFMLSELAKIILASLLFWCAQKSRNND